MLFITCFLLILSVLGSSDFGSVIVWESCFLSHCCLPKQSVRLVAKQSLIVVIFCYNCPIVSTYYVEFHIDFDQIFWGNKL